MEGHRDGSRLRYILCGASGSGKTTMAGILERELGLVRCISTTTRPPRPGETDGRDYHFKPNLDPADLFEHATFGQYQYGISWSDLAKGDFIILDPQGVDYYCQHYPFPLTVIQLQRSGIQVDEQRRARDQDAGFDGIHPDLLIQGETIEEMSHNLLLAIRQLEKQTRSLDGQIELARFRIPHVIENKQLDHIERIN